MSKENKDLCSRTFTGKYIELSDTHQSNFSRLCNKLLSENFIYGQIDSDKNDYYSILKMKEMVENYFNLIDYDLVQDDTLKIFYLQSKTDRNRIRFNKLETVLLIILRLLYEVKNRSVDSASNISITLDELLNELNKTAIYKAIPYKGELSDSLKKFRKLKIIECDIKNIDSHNVIKIFPTILFIVKLENIDEMTRRLESFISTSVEEQEDEVDED